jgi:hypothetical protein
MPTILTEEFAAEWIADGLSEQRINELATFKISAEAMTAHTIHKDFKTALDPMEGFTYDELPELGQALSIPPVKNPKKTAAVQGGLF